MSRARSRSSRHSSVRRSSPRRTSGRAAAWNFAGMDRVHMLIVAFALFTVYVVIRLFIVQIVDHQFYASLASDQHELVKQLQPERGELYAKDPYSDTGLALIAGNQTVHHVYANPKQITDVAKTVDVVAPLLGLDPELIRSRVSKQDDLYEPLKRQVTDQEVEALGAALKENGLAGIHWIPEDSRYYPEGKMVGALTGFVGIQEDKPKGQYGLEGYFDTELAGTAGHLTTELDASGRFIAIGDKSIVEAQDGDTLVLTIDKNIQYKACTMLEENVQKHGAKQGSLIVMDPNTGAILAMCNSPQYDPNHYSDVEDISVFVNDAISDQYEPGSVMKAVTMASAINEGKVTPYTTYEDTGVVNVGGFRITNADEKVYGVMDMIGVLENSINTGAIFAVQQIGNEKWYEYLQRFRFGKRIGIDINGENPGDISQVGLLQDVYSATSSFGHGVTVTPLQLVQAFGALANDGTMMKPYIIDRVVKSNGYQQQTQPEELGQPVSPEAASTVAAMLVRVIDEGHTKSAHVDGYFMAGKTGTAVIPLEDGSGYATGRYKHTFVGFGPASDPRFVILVKVDEPQDVRFAEGSTAPVFRELAKYLVNYLQIPQDHPE